MSALRKHPFTLLEVLIAFFIFSIGTGLLVTQFALSAARVSDGMKQWEQTHELINAAEYSLLADPGAALDKRFFNPDYLVSRKYHDPDFPEGVANSEIGLQLQTLTLTLFQRDRREKILDSLQIDCWRNSTSKEPGNDL